MKRINLVSILALITASALLVTCTQKNEKNHAPKNVIIFIGDGMGYNHVDATSIYLHGESSKLIFEGKDWQKVAQATYPAIMRIKPEVKYAAGYNPREAWNDTAYLKRDFTDSGAAGTALSTGYKTYRNSIGIGINGDTLMHLSEFAKTLGKSAGVITSVQLSHATPAAFAAHNEDRRNYEQIAQQMILKSRLDVLIGCGHPLFNNDAKPAEMGYQYVGGQELWSQITEGENVTDFTVNGTTYTLPDITGDGKPNAWKLISDSTDFASLAEGKNLPQRLLGIPTVHSTLQQSRSGSDNSEPWQQPRNQNLPTLAQKTIAAINVLNQNPKGFFLMVEGGAIDWAAHDNHPGRLIEEMEDFVNSVAAVVEWVEKYSSWDETLVIVTSDHETGLLTGVQDGSKVITPMVSKGKGVLPDMNWYSTDHTNSLVPVYARGSGSEFYRFLADEYDPVRGAFIQNTEVAKAIFMLWGHH